MNTRLSSCRKRKAALVEMIGAAFGASPYPGDANLLHPDCRDDDSDVERFYGSRDWKQIADHDIIGGYAAFSFLSAEGFQFLLPAFMVWCLENLGKSDAFALDSTIYSLNPMRRGKVDAFAASKYLRLTEPQRRCVVSFLQLICDFGRGKADSAAAEKALTQYWNNSSTDGGKVPK